MVTDLQSGAEGSEIRELQEQLLSIGYHLPRWGADGHLGDETLAAVAAFRHDRQIGKIGDDFPRLVPGAVRKAIAESFQKAAVVPTTPILRDLRVAHAGDQQKGVRRWSQINGITLHQTATLLGERPERWFNIACHLGVTRTGQILVLNALETLIWHGNGLNGGDIGVEIDGYFEGVEGLADTLWRPPGNPDLIALTPTSVQIEACRHAVQWIINEVAKAGGEIRFIHAHRQASNQRRSDPGSRIWREVGLWAQKTHSLADGGALYTVGKGLPIPEAWDPSRVGVRY